MIRGVVTLQPLRPTLAALLRLLCITSSVSLWRGSPARVISSTTMLILAKTQDLFNEKTSAKVQTQSGVCVCFDCRSLCRGSLGQTYNFLPFPHSQTSCGQPILCKMRPFWRRFIKRNKPSTSGNWLNAQLLMIVFHFCRTIDNMVVFELHKPN